MEDVDARVVAGRYRLLSRLGSGGMGTVWRAEDLLLDREVAVKEVTFPPGVPDDERELLRERTRREARLAARIESPSAVTVFDVVEEDGTPFLVMELVEARTLSEVVRADGALPPGRVAEVGLAVLGALEAAHREGVIHRDVKPGNVLLRDDGRVVLTDFGIATTSADPSLTSTGLLLGSPAYIAPERARGEAPGPPSDLWSLGATLFTAVEGRPPYDGGEALATVAAVVGGDRAPYVAAGPLAQVLEGLLERDPALRLTAPQARRLLEAARDQAALLPAAPPPDVALPRSAGRTTALPAAPAMARPARRRGGLVAAAVLAAAALGTGVVVSGTRDGADRTASPGTSPSPSVTVPAGWERHEEDDEGWALSHPAAWRVTMRNGLRQFRDEERRWTLRVDVRDPAGPSPVGAWEEQEQAFRARFSSYQRVRLEAHEFRGDPGADWEFTYTDDGARLRVLDRGFVRDGVGYALYWQVPADDWQESLRTFAQLEAGFEVLAGDGDG